MDGEGKRREGGEHGGAEAARGSGEEVEVDGFRAGSVLEDGENAGEGAAEVGGVESHGDVDRRRVSDGGCASPAVSERRSFTEGGELEAVSITGGE